MIHVRERRRGLWVVSHVEHFACFLTALAASFESHTLLHWLSPTVLIAGLHLSSLAFTSCTARLHHNTIHCVNLKALCAIVRELLGS